MKVAVSACGGGVGQSILKSLYNTEYKTIGIDCKSDAMGLYFADEGYLCVPCNHNDYIENMLSICIKSGADVLFPGLDAELDILSRNRNVFISNNITPIVSSYDVIELGDDKLSLQTFLKNKGFPYIKTATSFSEIRELDINFPLIIKPRVGGCRSKGVKTINTMQDMPTAFYDEVKNGLIVQELIKGEEYTCGSITFNNKVYGSISMKRELRNGDTYKAYVDNNKIIKKFIDDLLMEIKPFGPCNIQLMMRDDIPYVFEINPRCSGTTAARSLAGFNEPKMTCDYISGKKIKFAIKDIAILRYWNEQVVLKTMMEKVTNEGHINRRKWIFG